MGVKPLVLLALVACGGEDRTTDRCAQEGRRLTCTYDTLTLPAGDGEREVHFQIPSGEPPATGFPAVWLFQGALFSGEGMWQGRIGAPVGAYHQTRTVELLLDSGYAVITPEAAGNGLTAWNTNVPPHVGNWEDSPDAELVDGLFEFMQAGDFGFLDPDAVYAAGISSGGYMTSRLAEQHGGRFRALAIHSASWASCAGAACVLPEALPEDHPPTTFVHGGLDGVVPPGTSKRYHRRLTELAIDTERHVQPFRTHRWLDIAPEVFVDWFDAH